MSWLRVRTVVAEEVGRLCACFPGRGRQVFTANGALRRLWSQASGTPEAQLSVVEHWFIGAVCGVMSATAICPPEVGASFRMRVRFATPWLCVGVCVWVVGCGLWVVQVATKPARRRAVVETCTRW
jgi:hypothetical protein